MKPIRFLGDALKCLKEFPPDAQQDAGDRRAVPKANTAARSAEVYPMSTTTYASVWNAIADTPEQAANLRTRAELMQKIAAIVQANGWTQTQAATHCGITQPRMNDLLRGRVSRFSLDALVNIATAIGRRVHVELTLA